MPVDDGCLVTLGGLDEPTRSTGQVPDHAGQVWRDRLGVKDRDIGSEPLPEKAAIMQTPDVSRAAGDHLNSLFEGEGLALSDPVGQ